MYTASAIEFPLLVHAQKPFLSLIHGYKKTNDLVMSGSLAPWFLNQRLGTQELLISSSSGSPFTALWNDSYVLCLVSCCWKRGCFSSYLTGML